MAREIDTPGQSMLKAFGTLLAWFIATSMIIIILLGLVATIRWLWGIVF